MTDIEEAKARRPGTFVLAWAAHASVTEVFEPNRHDSSALAGRGVECGGGAAALPDEYGMIRQK